jgi:hypothetical protein
LQAYTNDVAALELYLGTAVDSFHDALRPNALGTTPGLTFRVQAALGTQKIFLPSGTTMAQDYVAIYRSLVASSPAIESPDLTASPEDRNIDTLRL